MLSRSPLVVWLQFYGCCMPVVVCEFENRVTGVGDRLELTCFVSSPSESVLWLYAPGETYDLVQHIYSEGRINSRWRPMCQVTTNATSSTLVIPSVDSDDAGFYECDEEHLENVVIRLRVKLTVTEESSTDKNVFSSTLVQKNKKPLSPAFNHVTENSRRNLTAIDGDAEGERFSEAKNNDRPLLHTLLYIISGLVPVLAIVVALIGISLVSRNLGRKGIRGNKTRQDGTNNNEESMTSNENVSPSIISDRSSIPNHQLPLMYGETPPTSLPIIFTDTWNIRESDDECQYWPIVTGGYVDCQSVFRPTTPIVYDVLQGRDKKRPGRPIAIW